MSFHLGKPILVMLLLAAASSVAVVFRRAPARADLTVWVFADSHARSYREPMSDTAMSLVDSFSRITGRSVDVQLLNARAEDVRLVSLFMSPDTGARAPDVVEIELSSIGKFFRPPVSEVGLLPLNDYLTKSGAMDEIVTSRFAPWSKRGVIFALPHDLHPVTLSYRKDLFDEAGVDFDAPRTWSELQDKCLDFQRYWAAHGHPDRRAMELEASASEDLLVMLLQRHMNLVDDENRVHLDEPLVAQTLAQYARMAAGKRQIGIDTAPGTLSFRDFADGNVCAFITPDWRGGYLKQYAKEASGNARMRPLPIFAPGDAPTSTWGGTGIAIPRSARDPEASWRLLHYFYFSKEGMASRHQFSSILPPVRARWADPIYQGADPYFGGQAIDRLYISLADKIPPRFVTPFSVAAQTALSVAVNKAVAYVNDHDDDGLEAACAGWLHDSAEEVRQWIRYGKFDP